MDIECIRVLLGILVFLLAFLVLSSGQGGEE